MAAYSAISWSRLASALAARGGAIAGGDPQDAVSAAHLRELNESYAVLSVVAFTPGTKDYKSIGTFPREQP